jgi:magnesium transporter
MSNNYPAESAGSIMSRRVLVATPNQTLKDILHKIATESWDDIQYAYVVDHNNLLIGVVDIAKFAGGHNGMEIRDFMAEVVATIRPNADQEKAVHLAIANDISGVPVVDKQGVFLGAVVANEIIDVMHDEHLEDALLASGIRKRGSSLFKLAKSRYVTVVATRAPWLIFGATAGIGLGYIVSIFEETLSKNVAIAFFIPVVAYIADSVGAQSQTITVRALATLKIKRAHYIFRELVIGVMLGVILGVMGMLGGMLISQSINVGIVVGLSLFAACTTASILASTISLALKALGRDPALGGGPIATAFQDIISVLIYFAFAVTLL